MLSVPIDMYILMSITRHGNRYGQLVFTMYKYLLHGCKDVIYLLSNPELFVQCRYAQRHTAVFVSNYIIGRQHVSCGCC